MMKRSPSISGLAAVSTVLILSNASVAHSDWKTLFKRETAEVPVLTPHWQAPEFYTSSLPDFDPDRTAFVRKAATSAGVEYDKRVSEIPTPLAMGAQVAAIKVNVSLEHNVKPRSFDERVNAVQREWLKYRLMKEAEAAVREAAAFLQREAHAFWGQKYSEDQILDLLVERETRELRAAEELWTRVRSEDKGVLAFHDEILRSPQLVLSDLRRDLPEKNNFFYDIERILSRKARADALSALKTDYLKYKSLVRDFGYKGLARFAQSALRSYEDRSKRIGKVIEAEAELVLPELRRTLSGARLDPTHAEGLLKVEKVIRKSEGGQPQIVDLPWQGTEWPTKAHPYFHATPREKKAKTWMVDQLREREATIRPRKDSAEMTLRDLRAEHRVQWLEKRIRRAMSAR